MTAKPKLYATAQISLEICPHCGITRPVMTELAHPITSGFDSTNMRIWSIYQCSTCGGVVLGVGPYVNPTPKSEITKLWPETRTISDAIPERAKSYLIQALASRNAPAGAIMLTASAIDSMLKDKGYKEGTLNSRIDAAANDHLITSEMATWAHEIRLDANDQRHADEAVPLPSTPDADKVFEFAEALAQFLYVLPATVTRGRAPEGAVSE